MSIRRRLTWTIPFLALVAAVAYTAWLAWQVRGDLQRAEDSVTGVRNGLESGDPASRRAAIAELRRESASAADRTDGLWWEALTHLPVMGDDATGVRALTSSLDTIAKRGVEPLSQTVDSLDGVLSHGRIDPVAVRGLQTPIHQAHEAFVAADADVAGLDSSGYAGALKLRFDRYSGLVDDTAQALSSAETATEVLPQMVGGDGPRDYLLVLQNNAEIRATGGLPGAWAQIHAAGGRLSIVRQGSANDFPERASPVLPLSRAELVLQHEQLGTFFHDANFTPDFPRAAELWRARWEEKFPGVGLDGVVSLDPVALSYMLDGTGPVEVGGVSLTRQNAVQALLSDAYRRLDPRQQDLFFQQAARAVFDASTHHLQDPVALVEGLNRAAREGRLLVASDESGVSKRLQGTRIVGALTAKDGTTPHVDIGINDVTAAKMSYYLRFWGDVRASACDDGRQTLTGTLTLNQDIDPQTAAQLPAYVTGEGDTRGALGAQTVIIPIYGPFGGKIEHISVDGRSLDRDIQVVDYRGRPATLVFADISSRKDVVFNWTMTTGRGQVGDPSLGLTPSVVPGNNDVVSKSAC